MNFHSLSLLVCLLSFEVFVGGFGSVRTPVTRWGWSQSVGSCRTSNGRLCMVVQQANTERDTPRRLYPIGNAGRRDRERKVRGKKKIQRDDDEKRGFGRCLVYCVGEGIDIVGLRTFVTSKMFSSYLRVENSGIDADDVLHVSNVLSNKGMLDELDEKYEVSMASNVTEAQRHAIAHDNFEEKARQMLLSKDIFYFDFGVVVLWGLSDEEVQDVLLSIEAFVKNAVSDEDFTEAQDELQFVYDPKKHAQKPGRMHRIRLRTMGGGGSAERMALSYGIAQSSKLFIHESKVQRRLEKVKHLPIELARTGRISARKQDLNALIGQIFVEQTEVNLFSSILDTPDFLWEDDAEGSTYSAIRSYLEVDDRVRLLNKRLGVVESVLEVLTAQVAERSGERLEWIIIWLISIEIVMGVAAMPLSFSKRLLGSVLVPLGIIAYSRWRK